MKTLLIVDDSEYMRSLIKKTVRNLDISVVGEAENGVAGAQKYKELMPDIVTLDLAMDEGDGITALKEIMSINPDAKVMIVSSTAGQGPIVKEASELGAKIVIDKNYIQDKLVDGITKLLS
jgi:two-component system chemotaxis response regulator CheY